jgi:hypothetical protein
MLAMSATRSPPRGGTPTRQVRRHGAVDPDSGEVVIIPRLPSVVGPNKPPAWNSWSEGQKIQHLLGMSLDCIHDYLAWPREDIDPYRLAAQAQVVRIVVNVAAKFGLKQMNAEQEAAAERFRKMIMEDMLATAGQSQANGEAKGG